MYSIGPCILGLLLPRNFDVVYVFGCWVSMLDVSVATMGLAFRALHIRVVGSTMLAYEQK